MRNILTIASREVRSLFVSPLAYVITIFFTFIMGWFFVGLVAAYSDYSMRASMSQAAAQFSVDDIIIRNFYSTLGVIMIFVAPILSMRVLAEERRLRTAEMILTAPVSTMQLVLGKYLGLMFFLGFILGLTLVYPIYLVFAGVAPEPGPLIAAYTGAFLMVGAFLGIGLFSSSLTSNQIVAAVVGFIICLFFWIVGFMGDIGGAAENLGPFLKSLSIAEHYNDFLKGVIETRSVVFYVTFIGFGLFLTGRVVDSMRWR
ncbi:MAG: ABC transporter permease [Acidobacteriota bacterium]